MSENSLELRNKFITKINNKIKDLNDNIALLAKVDNKIFKNSNSQFGGGNQFDRIKNINRQRGGAVGEGDPPTGRENAENMVELTVNMEMIQNLITLFGETQESLEHSYKSLAKLKEMSNMEIISEHMKRLADMKIKNQLKAEEFLLIMALRDLIKDEKITTKAAFEDEYGNYATASANNFDGLINQINAKTNPKTSAPYALKQLEPKAAEERLTEAMFTKSFYRGFTDFVDGVGAPPVDESQKYRRYY
jgi:spore coat protein CotH